MKCYYGWICTKGELWHKMKSNKIWNFSKDDMWPKLHKIKKKLEYDKMWSRLDMIRMKCDPDEILPNIKVMK